MHLPIPRVLLSCLSVIVCTLGTAGASAAPLLLKPFKESGFYAVGETVGWTISAPSAAIDRDGLPVNYRYVLKRDHKEVVQKGVLELDSGSARVEAKLDRPGMLYLEIIPWTPEAKSQVAAAAVEPEKLKPVAACPADFDAFWAEKISALKAVPAEPQVQPAPSVREGVEYATIKLKSIGGASVYGQIAKPSRSGKYPALLLLQWAGGPYPLEKQWVTERAAEGWLVLNVMPHDIPGNMPAEFYAALPQMLKNYNTLYTHDRDRNYFLQMYLGDYRAADYLTQHPEWDGKTFLAMGTSMGGQQSFAVAGLHPKVTHMIVHVPAGADSNGALHGRLSGYPFWDSSNPEVMKTALYFDAVNFAPRIKATSLVSMGFLDEVCPPVGIWTAFNQIAGRKEVVPLVHAAHNHQSTAEQQQAYTDRSKAWLNALVVGREPDVRSTR